MCFNNNVLELNLQKTMYINFSLQNETIKDDFEMFDHSKLCVSN